MTRSRESRDPRGPAVRTSTPSGRSARKWAPIIAAFMEGRQDELLSLQRTGARGRILAHLLDRAWEAMGLICVAEPVFVHHEPLPWYVTFASEKGVALRVHSFYNPDFVLRDGTWVEATLSENTAYKKLFRYGHQAKSLVVLWLDADTGFHKTACCGTVFPNASVRPVSSLYPDLLECDGSEELVRKLELLKELKGTLL